MSEVTTVIVLSTMRWMVPDVQLPGGRATVEQILQTTNSTLGKTVRTYESFEDDDFKEGGDCYEPGVDPFMYDDFAGFMESVWEYLNFRIYSLQRFTPKMKELLALVDEYLIETDGEVLS